MNTMPDEFDINGVIYRRVDFSARNEIQKIKALVCTQFGLLISDLTYGRQIKKVVPRWFVFTLSRERGMTLQAIADSFTREGRNMDHSTVSHGIEKLKDYALTDKTIEPTLTTLRKQLNIEGQIK